MKNGALVGLKQTIAALLVTTLIAPTATLSQVYANLVTNSAVSVDLDRTVVWQTHYAVNGFTNSGPADPYQIFKIQYLTVNGTVEQFSMPYVEYAHYIQANVTSDGNGALEIKFPKNYPSGNSELGGEALFFINGQEAYVERLDTSSCFYEFSIPFTGATTIDLVWSAFDEHFMGMDVPESCLPETIVQDVVVREGGIITPWHQLEAGVRTQEVVCQEELELLIDPTGKPYCATPASAEILNERWNSG